MGRATEAALLFLGESLDDMDHDENQLRSLRRHHEPEPHLCCDRAFHGFQPKKCPYRYRR